MKAIKFCLVLTYCLASQAIFAGDLDHSKKLVTAFWRADNDEDRALARQNLRDGAQNVNTLYKWLQEGPIYSSDVALGIQKNSRKGTKGTRFPFVFIVPESYDSQKKYPIEFHLHGGINVPKTTSLTRLKKRKSYIKRFEKLDQITVFPIAWNKAIWWQDEQAENLKEILREIKKTYNIDDNRAYLSGVSDGGTGSYFYAFKQPNQWAAFLPYIGSAAVLANPNAGGGFPLSFENLTNVTLHIINGEKDPLYPIEIISPIVDILKKQKTNHSFTVIKDGGHNLKWWQDEALKIATFKQNTQRNISPDLVRWETDRVDHYNRIHWVRIDGIVKKTGAGWIAASRNDNVFSVFTDGVTDFTLLLQPDVVDFNKPVIVLVNKEIRFNNKVEQDPKVLLNWAENLDRAELYTAELRLKIVN